MYGHDGFVIALEESIPTSELPMTISDELKNNFDNYEIKESEKITKGADTFYEVGLIVNSGEEVKNIACFFPKRLK